MDKNQVNSTIELIQKLPNKYISCIDIGIYEGLTSRQHKRINNLINKICNKHNIINEWDK